MQRSHGAATVQLGPGGLIDLRQSGSAKAMLPRIGGMPEVVFLNTSGGLAAGDSLALNLSLNARTRALATTQTAERAYRAEGPPARVDVRMQVGAGGWLDWLPQETILFNRARLHRRTEIHLARDAGCLMLEMIVLGRLAMGEQITRLDLHDSRRVWQDGRLVHHDALAIGSETLARLDGPALLNGARAIATLAMIAPDAPDLLTKARAVLDEPRVTSAASAPAGRLVIRMLSDDGWPLRRQINRLLGALRPDSLPRVWQV